MAYPPFEAGFPDQIRRGSGVYASFLALYLSKMEIYASLIGVYASIIPFYR
jgi:hypothetical protein